MHSNYKERVIDTLACVVGPDGELIRKDGLDESLLTGARRLQSLQSGRLVSVRGPGPIYTWSRFITVCAAWYPHMPCTPPPGGVEALQKKRRGLGVV